LPLIAESQYQEETLYLATDDEIVYWWTEGGIILTGEDWFDDISTAYGINTLIDVTPWCIESEPDNHYYYLTFDATYDVPDIITDFEVEVEVDNA
jgi:hypothetical protein